MTSVPAAEPVQPEPVYAALAAFMAELAAAGVGHVVISPGSRSTPLTLSAWWQPAFTCEVVLDERVAAFRALGIGRATRRPAALICTSGTAAANYLPAVVEANHGGVPLLVLTADRPPELREWGAGQTIDQVHLFGRNVRWFAETPVPGDAPIAQLRRLAARAVAETTGDLPGPVHLNVPLREPLDPREPPVPPGVAELHGVVRDVRPGPAAVEAIAELVHRHERGIVLAGPADLDPDAARAVAELAAAAGWPVLADPLSGLRRGAHVPGGVVLGTGDHLLKVPAFADDHTPEAVLRIGGTPTSKPAKLWLEAHRPERVVVVGPPGRWEEPSFTATEVIVAEAGALAAAVLERGVVRRPESAWLRTWLAADHAAEAAIDDVLADGPLLAPLVARTLGDVLPEGAVLVASSSMPVRDVDAFVRAGASPLRVLANRGANGIDGVVSTAAGVAAAGVGPTVALLGDLALLHDLGGLVAAAQDRTTLVVVVVDDAGGGIFSFLPVARHGDAVDFTALFRTPQAVDLASLAGIGGLRYEAVTDAAGLGRAAGLGLGAPGVTLVHVRIDADANLAQHRAVTAAVAAAITPRSA